VVVDVPLQGKLSRPSLT